LQKNLWLNILLKIDVYVKAPWAMAKNFTGVFFIYFFLSLKKHYTVKSIQDISFASNLIKTYSEKDVKTIQKIDILSWVNESRTYLPFVPDYDGHDINVTYIQKSDPIIKKQLSCARLRLATILETKFLK
jgi:hypothetical protein